MQNWSISAQTGRHDAGCARILLEGKYLFDYIDIEADFLKHKLIILPDRVSIDEELTKKLKEFTQNGGKVLATGMSGIDENGRFMLDFGCEFDGKNGFSPSYARPRFDVKSLRNSAYLIYSDEYKIKNVTGEVLVECENPYFNRTPEHFCSHHHAPNNPDDKKPAVVMGRDGVYIAWDIFNEYASVGSIAVKEMVVEIIEKLMPNKTVKTNLPAQGVITVTKQGDRKNVHLLYAAPARRGEYTDIIEDLLPVYDTMVSVKCEARPQRVFLAPERKEISFDYDGAYTHFKVDKFECHKIVVLEF